MNGNGKWIARAIAATMAVMGIAAASGGWYATSRQVDVNTKDIGNCEMAIDHNREDITTLKVTTERIDTNVKTLLKRLPE